MRFVFSVGDFLGLTPKVQTKAKINKWDNIKLKDYLTYCNILQVYPYCHKWQNFLCPTKETINRVNRPHTGWMKIFTSYLEHNANPEISQLLFSPDSLLLLLSWQFSTSSWQHLQRLMFNGAPPNPRFRRTRGLNQAPSDHQERSWPPPRSGSHGLHRH